MAQGLPSFTCLLWPLWLQGPHKDPQTFAEAWLGYCVAGCGHHGDGAWGLGREMVSAVPRNKGPLTSGDAKDRLRVRYARRHHLHNQVRAVSKERQAPQASGGYEKGVRHEDGGVSAFAMKTFYSGLGDVDV